MERQILSMTFKYFAWIAFFLGGTLGDEASGIASKHSELNVQGKLQRNKESCQKGKRSMSTSPMIFIEKH